VRAHTQTLAQEEGDDGVDELAPWEDQLQCVDNASVMQLRAQCARVGSALTREDLPEGEDAEVCTVEEKEEVPLPTLMPPPPHHHHRLHHRLRLNARGHQWSDWSTAAATSSVLCTPRFKPS
jgi:hypothetical protein